MKKHQQARKKLTRRDYDRMWGEGGPYSQVRLSHEIRVLNDSISRIFLVVEAEINPFTFEYVEKHRSHFSPDDPIQGLLDHADDRGSKFGYVVCFGTVESKEEGASDFAEARAKEAVTELVRMHKFVMDAFGFKKAGTESVVWEDDPPRSRFVWNPATGKVEEVKDICWDGETTIGVPAAVKNNKGRMFIVLAFAKGFLHETAATKVLVKNLDKTSAKFRVEIENAESFSEYALLTVLVPFDVAPADFIEGTIGACNTAWKKPMFEESYLTTNVKRPTPDEIARFFKGLNLKGWRNG